MKFLSFFVTSSLFIIQAHGQTITGKVFDETSGEPLEYASIGIVETRMGTITDEKGKFNLEVKDQSPKAIVRFSMIGFNAETFSIEELSNKENIIKLKELPIQLAEVVIRPSGKLKKVGPTSYTWHGGLCGWQGTGFGKGYEIGTKLELGALPVKLKSLHIHVFKQPFDTCLFRLHIRSIIDSMPFDELLSNNILVVVANNSGWVDIELSDYNLVFKGDIVLTLEWLKVIGLNKNRLIKMNGSKEYTANVLFSLKRNQGCIYTKWGSEDKWSRKGNESPSFYLTVQE